MVIGCVVVCVGYAGCVEEGVVRWSIKAGTMLCDVREVCVT